MSNFNPNLEKAISRITRMETLFCEVAQCFEENPQSIKENTHLQTAIKTLSDYLSGEWLKDYELHEQGLVPSTIKCGVLSEDGLYNLLCDIKEWWDTQI